MNDTTIQAKVDEFVAATKGFTSVDIANAIKTDGEWIGNREVAAWLRRWTPPGNYGITKVEVELADGGTARAGIYLPDTMAVKDYTATSQEAMTPDQFEALHGFNPVAVTTQPKDYPAPDTDADPKLTPAQDKMMDSLGAAGKALVSRFKWAPNAK